MRRHAVVLLLVLFMVELSTHAWLLTKKEKKGLWDSLSVKLPGFLSGSMKLPMTEGEAIRKGWRKTDRSGCDGNNMFRGNRYRFGSEYGTMLLFDSNGRITGMQAAIPTSVPMVSKRRYMMPIENDRYHLTVYFNDPKSICNAPKRGNRDIGDRLLVQVGGTWKETMNVPLNSKDLGSTLWVKGKCVPSFGTYYWYNVSKTMDCEEVFPVFVTYSSSNEINGFGWSIKGRFEDPKFDHPPPSLASLAFDSRTFPDCIRTSNTRGSAQVVFLQSEYSFCPLFG